PFDELFSVAPVRNTLARVEIVLGWLMNENDTFNFSALIHRNTPQDVRFQWCWTDSIEMCWNYVGSWFAVRRAQNRMT
ncbi:hypothetical protein BRC79_04680, partial [Halobacteriales archaeon QH_8_67_27]